GAIRPCTSGTDVHRRDRSRRRTAGGRVSARCCRSGPVRRLAMATDCGASHQPAMASVHGSFKPRLLDCHSIAGAMDASERSVPDTPLDDVTSTPVKPPPIKWYSRSALEESRTTAASERARFEETIADAHARLARARAAVGLHQTMMDMLLGSQREIR